jgi:hypothetical protein
VDEEKSLNDRVFVCLGKLREKKKHHAWVMTINKTFDEITFWEVNRHRKFTLQGRVLSGEDQKL